MEKRDSIFDAVISYFKSGKRARIILVLALVGAVILIFGAFSGGDTKSEDVDSEGIEARLEELCSSVSGVGRCSVMVNYERSEKSYGAAAEPRVESVTVVCKGASNPKVRQELTSILTSLFGIGANRVYIAQYK